MVQEGGSSSVASSPLQCFSMMSISPTALSSPYPPCFSELKSDERGLYLIHLLRNCVNHVATGNLELANACLEHISLLASPDGDTMQRIASYFTEALARRILKSWPGLYRALNSTKICSVSETILVHKHFFELCPFLKLAYLISNQAIMEAMEGEKMVHIIDLNASEPAQWIVLLQTLRARPEGPPHLRITGVHEQKEILDHTAVMLSEEAEKLDIPFQFNPVVSKLENINLENLRVKTGEALAISSVLQLHCLLASDDDCGLRRAPTPSTKNSSVAPLRRIMQMSHQENLGELLEKDHMNGYSPSPDSASSLPLSLAISTKMEGFLASLWGLSPKIMVLTEQESNHNGSTLSERFKEALNFYAALFDCLDSTVAKLSMERVMVEKMLFGEEIMNIITCEGLERKERHEKLERWMQRLDMARFERVPLSYYGLLQTKRLLQNYGCDGYNVREENGCFVLCWQNHTLFSVSAWRCRRYD